MKSNKISNATVFFKRFFLLQEFKTCQVKMPFLERFFKNIIHDGKPGDDTVTVSIRSIAFHEETRLQASKGSTDCGEVDIGQ